MYSFVFITHGDLGKTLFEIASEIMDVDIRERAEFFTIDFSMAAELNDMQVNLEKAVGSFIEKGSKVVIFVDIFGGSPSNVAFSFAKNESVDVLSGVNLPMVMYALEHRDSGEEIEKMVDGIIRSGSQNITSARNLIKKRASK
ncbi:hypothetical protein J6Z39_02735 [bacterium]|nr:hypothetical protein [bacterium]MBR6244993.1 hypothetical protein [bacterium]